MWAKIITIKIIKDLNYFSLWALNLFKCFEECYEENYNLNVLNSYVLKKTTI